MIETKFDKRALAEAYNILIMLEREKFEKIPANVINGIHDNMDLSYDVELEKIEDGEILEDTEKILSVIYTDYLATPEEKEIVLRLANATLKPREEVNVDNQDVKLHKVKKENIIIKILNKIKKFLKLK